MTTDSDHGSISRGIGRRNAQNQMTYRTNDIAKLFGKTTQWVYYCERADVYRRRDGSLIIPRRTTPPNAKSGYRTYSNDDVGDIADALYRRRIITKDKWLEVLGFVATHELAEDDALDGELA